MPCEKHEANGKVTRILPARVGELSEGMSTREGSRFSSTSAVFSSLSQCNDAKWQSKYSPVCKLSDSTERYAGGTRGCCLQFHEAFSNVVCGGRNGKRERLKEKYHHDEEEAMHFD